MASKKSKFKPVDPKINFPRIEEEILKFWQKEKIFEKSLGSRKSAKKFTFYDGPPFASGLPHYGHILAMTIKDAITRFKTMEGYFVSRRLGWDTHGLPVEYEVEKDLGISGKKDIEKMGVGKFNEACRNIVFRYTNEWEKTIDRMGRWADKKNTYATLNTDYMESIWWVFKSLWDKGLIYKGFRSMPYCPRCGTPLSNFETNQGYKDDVKDPSIYIKFRLKDDPGTFLLAWTTTPWTLPGNAALAVHPKIKYVKVKAGDDFLILAKERLSVLDDLRDPKEISVNNLIGKEYVPLFNFFQKDKKSGAKASYLLDPKDIQKDAYKVVQADFVSTEEGTGIVHIAPAFGEDDMELGKKENLPQIQPVDKNGEFTIEPYKGVFVKKADHQIIDYLKESQNLYKAETIKHTYPFCWRCETPLLYYAIPNWFVIVSEFRDQLVKNNKTIHWMPAHIQEGRFGNWLAEARDWSISRNRFWGTPLPVWQCEKCKEYQVFGSVKDLKEAGLNFDELVKDSKILFDGGKQKSTSYPVDLHRPYIDKLIARCQCGGKAKRISEVLDCWFESGSMPYAQDHYPFENKKAWEENFPADFIAEGLDQTRGWFYTLHVLASLLFDKPAFKNIIVNGIVVDKEGKKLSKRLRNYPEPEEVFKKHGADAMRFYLLASPASLAQDVRFSSEAVEEIVRRLFLILWNIYSFFVTYANLNKWSPDAANDPAESNNILDQWIISELNLLVKKSTDAADNYDLPGATRPIVDFVNDMSTWYIRRSRDRVGSNAKDPDNVNSFFQTSYYSLVTLCKLLAPYCPFISENIYKNLTGELSVHLASMPTVNNNQINLKLQKQMQKAREIVETAHALRKVTRVRVRQPLSKLLYPGERLPKEIEDLIADEINVKSAVNSKVKKIYLETKITKELKAEGEAREIVRQIQQTRKESGCQLDEKITVILPSWPKEFEDYIKKQTLAKQIIKGTGLAIKRN
ncbi:hypothetical protein A2165_02200 [Candidatus Curtissbacteria bacterium RBG_13_40_7]|uniref:Isoleucine--tRNA ligase n=1 Tax=Candidatus Curtissbacteria bacterium RBG_13_40_7 TaxID=1797706 RepID=A0A1F5FYB7_9BACT|nr:MAG: hypothetical protein A2165_02200 [Candidatus Curtissbacteria bacterium RBG_13_40_7]